jgi:hypothetical protein
MFPTPKQLLVPNIYLYESEPMVKPTGFREYDVLAVRQGNQPDGHAAWYAARRTRHQARDRRAA